MSATVPAYNPLAIKLWATLSIVLGLALFAMFVFGDSFLHAGKVVWDLLRWLFRPII